MASLGDNEIAEKKGGQVYRCFTEIPSLSLVQIFMISKNTCSVFIFLWGRG